MQRGRGGIEFEDVRLGAGEIATRTHHVCVSCTISLHRGEIIQTLSSYWIDLKRRDVVAGLRYGIEGMRVGGFRRLVVPPRLAYGDKGVPACGVPPNAMLTCSVELLQIKGQTDR
jgi:FKBP-type peptidyl-prolyl cis-trans isomerase